MARSTLTKTTRTPRSPNLEAMSPRALVEHLLATYEWSASERRRLTAAVRRFAKLDPRTEPQRPSWMANPVDIGDRLFLGVIDDYDTYLYPPHETRSTAMLKRGCASAGSAGQARRHWDGEGRSIRSGVIRSHLPELIDYVEAYCAWKGWLW